MNRRLPGCRQHCMRRIRTILLDLGNVLIFHDNQLLFRSIGNRAGMSAEAVERLVTGDLWNAIHRGDLDSDGIRRELCRTLRLEIGSSEFVKLWNCHFRLHHEMIAEVDRLVGRVKLGALSNTNALHAEYFQAQLPILKKFDQILLSHELRMMKPEPAIFLEALRRLDSGAAETVFFDDLPAYVEAARSLGIQAHLFRSVAEFRSELLSLGL